MCREQAPLSNLALGLKFGVHLSDWADEYDLSGYLLYDNALRLWAARLSGDARTDVISHQLERFADGSTMIAGFHKARRHTQFDGFGNAISCYLGVGPTDAMLARAEGLTRFDLVPAFWPPVGESEPRYASLGRRNRPGRYHNGGLWPVITGFWALAARRAGQTALADRWLSGIARTNETYDFPEYLDAFTGKPGGVRFMAWSAAAEVIAQQTELR